MDNTRLKAAKCGDKKAVSTLLNQNINYIYWIAHKLSTSNISFEDLVSEGKIGFLKALKNYDTENTSEFLAYAYPYIKGEILKYISKNTFCVHFPDYKVRDYLSSKKQFKNLFQFKNYRYSSSISLDNAKQVYAKNEFERIENHVFLTQLFNFCRLSKLEIFILKKFYKDQMKLKDISILLNLKKSKVVRIKKSALKKLRLAIFLQDDEKNCAVEGR